MYIDLRRVTPNTMPSAGCTVLVLSIIHCLNSKHHLIVSEPRTAVEEGGKSTSTSDKRRFNETTHPPTNHSSLTLSDMVPYFEIVQLIVQPISPNRKVDIGISVEFYAFHRTFSMYLHRATEIYSAIILPTTKVVSFASTGSRTWAVGDLGVAVLVGIETDCPKCSRIYGTMYRDDLEFAVHALTESYFVEPISKYPPLNRTGKHLAVVYRRSDIRFAASNDSKSGHFSKKYAKILKKGTFQKRARHRRHILAEPAQSCDLLVAADHTFFQNIAHRDMGQVITEMVNHVAAADFVFRMTDFDDDSVADDIGFSIGRIHVFQDATTPEYAMRRVDTGPEDTLLAFTAYNFGQFCAAVLFTFRDFGQTLGISYRSSQKDINYGICAHPTAIVESQQFVAAITMNTVMVTQLSGGGVIPRAILSLVVTHELGHSFGADHDNDFPNMECNPSRTRLGRYIMHSTRDLYDFLLSKNDWTFSPCSVLSIQKVIAVRRDTCFRKRPFPICGNLILDRGEQCDCGNFYSCAAIDPCCSPPSLTSIGPTGGCVYAAEKGCNCSPRWDLCCSSSGLVRSSAEAFVCRSATDCTMGSVCDGSSASCPAPRFVADETACAGGEGRCHHGVCSRSVCTLNGLADCSCQWPESAKCKVCCGCIFSSGQLSCLPAEWLSLSLGPGRGLVQRPLYLLPGTQCDSGKGTCNSNSVCVRP